MDDVAAIGAALRERMHARVSLALREMLLTELAAQRRAVLQGEDPRRQFGYGRVAHLYTEDDGTAMHEEIRAAFLLVSGRMLGVAKEQTHE